MKKIMPWLIGIVFIGLLIGGWWFEGSQFASSPAAVATTDTTTANLSGKALRDAATAAAGYRTSLKVNGKVPLSADSLPRNPNPLFAPAQ